VQVELNLWHQDNLLNGVVAYCLKHNIELIAYRPLGGIRRRRAMTLDPKVAGVAERHGVTGAEILLAWLHRLPGLISLPGRTSAQPETVPAGLPPGEYRLVERLQSAVDGSALVLAAPFTVLG